MAHVIGLDLGNVNILASIIIGMDETTRRNGSAVDLIPPERPMGIPSTFYYSKNQGERLCTEAMNTDTDPRFRFNLLKRHLNEKFTCDGKTFEYNYALKQVCRQALNTCLAELENRYHETTNLVSLAFPAAFQDPAKVALKKLLESVELSNGQKVKVVGMISEPAAAALDYLASHSLGEKTVLVCDLGGGTYDLALVKAYPEGKSNGSDGIKYYDCCDHNGINIGGSDFDQIIYDMITKRVKVEMNEFQSSALRNEYAEKIKIELSTRESTSPVLGICGIFDLLTITREDFQSNADPLMKDIIAATGKMLDNQLLPDPDLILLTGGGTSMPMIKEALVANFPKYSDKIATHDPHYAISHGAARFGSENDLPSPIQLRTSYAYGTSFYSEKYKKNAVAIMIPAGTAYPYESEEFRFFTRFPDYESIYNSVYQAKSTDPKMLDGSKKSENTYMTDDFLFIINKDYKFGKKVPAETPIINKMRIDADGIIHMSIYEPGKADKKIEVIAGEVVTG